MAISPSSSFGGLPATYCNHHFKHTYTRWPKPPSSPALLGSKDELQFSVVRKNTTPTNLITLITRVNVKNLLLNIGEIESILAAYFI